MSAQLFMTSVRKDIIYASAISFKIVIHLSLQISSQINSNESMQINFLVCDKCWIEHNLLS